MARPARDYRTGSLQAYKEFKKKYKDIKITYAEWKKVAYIYGELFYMTILEKGCNTRIPFGLGNLTIVKKKLSPFYNDRNTLPVDWERTRELWEEDPQAEKDKILVRHLNAHTGGWRFRWKWSKKDMRVGNRAIWKMDMCRKASRELNKFLRKDTLYQSLYREN